MSGIHIKKLNQGDYSRAETIMQGRHLMTRGISGWPCVFRVKLGDFVETSNLATSLKPPI